MSYPSLGYSDDLLILIPRIHGLDMMGKTSESFACEYGLTFVLVRKQSAFVLIKMHVRSIVKWK